MKPEQKAKRLIYAFGKETAVIVVAEILEALEVYSYTNTMYDDPETGKIRTDDNGVDDYWREVKRIITER